VHSPCQELRPNDVLHIHHDRRFGIGRQSLGLEGLSRYDEVAVDEIRHRCLSACSYLRARTVEPISQLRAMVRNLNSGDSVVLQVERKGRFAISSIREGVNLELSAQVGGGAIRRR
jgi:hypothetical protein